MNLQHENKDINTSGVDIEDMADPKKGLMTMVARICKPIVHSDKKIGEMNGKWAALFRIVLVLSFLGIPALGTWGMWVTRSIWRTENHIESTIKFEERIDVLEKTGAILERVDKRVETIIEDLKARPNPEQVKDQVEDNTQAIKSVEDKVTALDKTNSDEHNKVTQEFTSLLSKLENENATDHARISTTLEFIKEKVSK